MIFFLFISNQSTHFGIIQRVIIKFEIKNQNINNKIVKNLGGLYLIGTERNNSRRIDNQLRGRCGRQGDPGTSRFFLSLEDSLFRNFGSSKLQNLFDNFC